MSSYAIVLNFYLTQSFTLSINISVVFISFIIVSNHYYFGLHFLLLHPFASTLLLHLIYLLIAYSNYFSIFSLIYRNQAHVTYLFIILSFLFILLISLSILIYLHSYFVLLFYPLLKIVCHITLLVSLQSNIISFLKNVLHYVSNNKCNTNYSIKIIGIKINYLQKILKIIIL